MIRFVVFGWDIQDNFSEVERFFDEILIKLGSDKLP